MYIQLRRYWTQFSSMRSVEVSRGEWKFLLLCILKYWYLIIQNNGKTLRLYHGTRHRGSEIEDNSSVDRVYVVYNTCACWWTCSKGGLRARASTWCSSLHGRLTDIHACTWSLHWWSSFLKSSSLFKKCRTAFKSFIKCIDVKCTLIL